MPGLSKGVAVGDEVDGSTPVEPLVAAAGHADATAAGRNGAAGGSRRCSGGGEPRLRAGPYWLEWRRDGAGDAGGRGDRLAALYYSKLVEWLGTRARLGARVRARSVPDDRRRHRRGDPRHRAGVAVSCRSVPLCALSRPTRVGAWRRQACGCGRGLARRRHDRDRRPTRRAFSPIGLCSAAVGAPTTGFGDHPAAIRGVSSAQHLDLLVLANGVADAAVSQRT